MKKKNGNKLINLGIIVAAIFGIIAFATKQSSKVNIDYDTMTNEEIEVVIEESSDNLEIKELSELAEAERMQRYVYNFMETIENGKYEKAYEMLYDEFKEQYFPTVDDFRQYAKTKFPRMFSLEYTNIERIGDIYVLWVTISDLLGSSNYKIETNFVVQENDLNDYVLSFSVK